MGVDRDDRRQHQRVDTNLSALVLARHNAGVQVAIVSVSLGGVRVVGEVTLAVGEQVQMLFEIDGRPVDTRAEVVRAEKLDMSNDHVALRFVDLSPDAKEALRALVASVHVDLDNTQS